MLNDLRVAADAVARDPGVLGVRGALDRRQAKQVTKARRDAKVAC